MTEESKIKVYGYDDLDRKELVSYLYDSAHLNDFMNKQGWGNKRRKKFIELLDNYRQGITDNQINEINEAHRVVDDSGQRHNTEEKYNLVSKWDPNAYMVNYINSAVSAIGKKKVDESAEENTLKTPLSGTYFSVITPYFAPAGLDYELFQQMDTKGSDGKYTTSHRASTIATAIETYLNSKEFKNTDWSKQGGIDVVRNKLQAIAKNPFTAQNALLLGLTNDEYKKLTATDSLSSLNTVVADGLSDQYGYAQPPASPDNSSEKQEAPAEKTDTEPVTFANATSDQLLAALASEATAEGADPSIVELYNRAKNVTDPNILKSIAKDYKTLRLNAINKSNITGWMYTTHKELWDPELLIRTKNSNGIYKYGQEQVVTDIPMMINKSFKALSELVNTVYPHFSSSDRGSFFHEGNKYGTLNAHDFVNMSLIGRDKAVQRPGSRIHLSTVGELFHTYLPLLEANGFGTKDDKTKGVFGKWQKIVSPKGTIYKLLSSRAADNSYIYMYRAKSGKLWFYRSKTTNPNDWTKEYNDWKKQNTAKKAKGGILKAQTAAGWTQYMKQQASQQKQQETQDKQESAKQTRSAPMVKVSGKNIDESEGRDYEMNGADYANLVAGVADIVASLSGNPMANLATGITSMTTDAIANATHGASAEDVLKNLGMNAGITALSVIPGAGISSKIARMRPLIQGILRTITVGGNITAGSLLASKGIENWNYQDWLTFGKLLTGSGGAYKKRADIQTARENNDRRILSIQYPKSEESNSNLSKKQQKLQTKLPYDIEKVRQTYVTENGKINTSKIQEDFSGLDKTHTPYLPARWTQEVHPTQESITHTIQSDLLGNHWWNNMTPDWHPFAAKRAKSQQKAEELIGSQKKKNSASNNSSTNSSNGSTSSPSNGSTSRQRVISSKAKKVLSKATEAMKWAAGWKERLNVRNNSNNGVPSNREGGILRADKGLDTKKIKLSDIQSQDYADDDAIFDYHTLYGVHPTENNDGTYDYTKVYYGNAWESNGPGTVSATYSSTGNNQVFGNSRKNAHTVENSQLYKDATERLIASLKAYISDRYSEDAKYFDNWAKMVDASTDISDAAKLRDAEGNLKTSWTIPTANQNYGDNQARGGQSGTYTDAEDYVRHLRTDGDFAWRHDDFIRKGTRFYRLNAKGEKEYLKGLTEEQIKQNNFKQSDPENMSIDDKGIQWTDIKITDPSEIDGGGGEGKPGTKQILDLYPAIETAKLSLTDKYNDIIRDLKIPGYRVTANNYQHQVADRLDKVNAYQAAIGNMMHQASKANGSSLQAYNAQYLTGADKSNEYSIAGATARNTNLAAHTEKSEAAGQKTMESHTTANNTNAQLAYQQQMLNYEKEKDYYKAKLGNITNWINAMEKRYVIDPYVEGKALSLASAQKAAELAYTSNPLVIKAQEEFNKAYAKNSTNPAYDYRTSPEYKALTQAQSNAMRNYYNTVWASQAKWNPYFIPISTDEEVSAKKKGGTFTEYNKTARHNNTEFNKTIKHVTDLATKSSLDSIIKEVIKTKRNK